MSSVESSSTAPVERRFKTEGTKAVPKRTLLGSNLDFFKPAVSAEGDEANDRALLALIAKKREKKQVNIPPEWERKYLQPLKDQLEKRQAEFARTEAKFASSANAVVVLSELGQAAAGDTAMMDHLWSLTDGGSSYEPSVNQHIRHHPQTTFRNVECQINEADLLNADMLRRKAGDESEDNELNFFRKAAQSTNLLKKSFDLDLNQNESNYSADYLGWSPTNLQPDRLFKKKLKPRKIVQINPDDLPKNIVHRQDDPKILEWMNSDDFKMRLNEVQVSKRKPSEKASMLERIRNERPRIPSVSACDQMGLIIRANIFPTNFYQQPRIGVIKATHNAEVFQQRDVTMPSKFRHQRDGDTKWTEENILAERQRRAWDSYFAEKKSKTGQNE